MPSDGFLNDVVIQLEGIPAFKIRIAVQKGVVAEFEPHRRLPVWLRIDPEEHAEDWFDTDDHLRPGRSNKLVKYADRIERSQQRPRAA